MGRNFRQRMKASPGKATGGAVLLAAPVTPTGADLPIWLRSNGVTPGSAGATITSWANSGNTGTTFFANGSLITTIDASTGNVAAAKSGQPAANLSCNGGFSPHSTGFFSGSLVFTLPVGTAQRCCVYGKGDNGGGGRYEYEIGISATNFPYITLYQLPGGTYASIASTELYTPGVPVCLQWVFTEGTRLDFWVNGGTSEKTTSFTGAMSTTVGIVDFGQRGDSVNPCPTNTLFQEVTNYSTAKSTAFMSSELAYMANRFGLVGCSDLALG